METAKFCIECGKPIPPEAKHCPNCGAEVVVEQTPVPGEVERPIAYSPPPVPQQTPSAGPYGAPASQQPAPYGGSGRVPPQGTYGGPPPGAGMVHAGPQQGRVKAQRAPSRKRLGGGTLTLIAGIVMLAMHALVLKGGLTASNLGVDLSIIVCGFLMLFARGGAQRRTCLRGESGRIGRRRDASVGSFRGDIRRWVQWNRCVSIVRSVGVGDSDAHRCGWVPGCAGQPVPSLLTRERDQSDTVYCEQSHRLFRFNGGSRPLDRARRVAWPCLSLLQDWQRIEACYTGDGK
jgi:hypothetical protein